MRSYYIVSVFVMRRARSRSRTPTRAQSRLGVRKITHVNFLDFKPGNGIYKNRCDVLILSLTKQDEIIFFFIYNLDIGQFQFFLYTDRAGNYKIKHGDKFDLSLCRVNSPEKDELHVTQFLLHFACLNHV